MRHLSALFLLVLWHGVAHAQTIALPEMKDAPIVNLFNDMEIIAEKRDSFDATFPYFLRIARVYSYGECSGKPQTCPKQFVYIGISSRDEDPDRKLYRLPDAYGWELAAWLYLPRRESPEEFIVFHMKKKVIAKDITRGWWSDELYEIRVNIFSGAMRKVN